MLKDQLKSAKFSSAIFEQNLIASFQQGSKTAFAKLYDHYAPALLGAISRIVKDNLAAEKILQESFRIIWGNKETYNPAKERFFTWIIKIARRACADCTIEGSFKCNEIHEAINLVYAKDIKNFFVEKQRVEGSNFAPGFEKKQLQALDLIYIKNFTFEDAARQLNIPLNIFLANLVFSIKRLQDNPTA